MTERLRRSLVGVCAMAYATVAATSLWPPATHVRSGDQNGDGRPDIWRTYDYRGHLSQVAIDTNLDGRADIQEYYERGALVRRESDRDFNDRVDLVEEFDPTTRERARSVVDIDFDGTADLLVLFRDGQPIFSKWAHPVAPVLATGVAALDAETPRRAASDPLAPLGDPFSADLSVRAAHVLANAGDAVGHSTSGGLPALRRGVARPLSSLAILGSCVSRPASASIGPHSPRGPPPASSLA